MAWFPWSVSARMARLEERMDELEASSQQQIDEVTGQLTTVEQNVEQLQSNLADSASKLEAEITSLEQQIQSGNPPANLDGLRAIADELNQHVATAEQAASDIGNIEPSPVGPASEPAQPDPLGVGSPDTARPTPPQVGQPREAAGSEDEERREEDSEEEERREEDRASE